LPSSPHRALRALIAVPILIFLALALVACGGGGGESDEDPQQVLEETFSGDAELTSGRVEVRLETSAEGEQGGNFTADFAGPFQFEGDEFPRFDFDLRAEGSGAGRDIDFEGGAVSTGQEGFVSYKGQDYEVDKSIFEQFKSRYEKLQKQGEEQAGKDSNLFSGLGIQPINWLTDLRNEGTEDVEGAETIHISGRADPGKLATDFQRIITRAAQQIPGGQVRKPSAQEVKRFEESVKQADLDVFTGSEDKIVRKLEGSIVVEPPRDSGAQVERQSLNFSITFSDVNEDQTIEGPGDAKPLSELLQQLGVNFGGLGGASGGGAGGDGASSAQSQRYLECLRKAQGASEIQNCAKLLQ
jgi:hypothetical protein